MAILKNDDLSFSLNFFPNSRYEFAFLWKGIPLINPALIDSNKAENMGFIETTECDGDFKYFFNEFGYALEKDEPFGWEAADADLGFAIYPETHFPFLQEHQKFSLNNKPLVRNKPFSKDSQSTKYFTVIVRSDAGHLIGANMIYGSGPMINFIVEKHELVTFLHQCKSEYFKYYRNNQNG